MLRSSVTHLTTSTTGGAGIAALRLHRSLLERDFESKLIFRNGTTSALKCVRWRANASIYSRLHEKIADVVTQKRTIGKNFFTSPLNPIGRRIHDILGASEPAVLHLHWISRWIDYRSFFQGLKKSIPIVWSLHDMNPLTGGCHLPGACQKFAGDCSACPQFRASLWDRQPALRFQNIKEEVFRNHEIHVVANSSWMQRAAERSRLGKLAKSIRMIHLGVDTNAFQPRDKQMAREVLGISSDRFVVAFGSADLNDENKNLKLICKAMEGSPLRSRFQLLLLGSGWPDFPLPVAHTAAGWTDNSHLLSIVYSAADVLVMPSRFESFGLTALEAMSCGTPVIVSNTGGLTDIVRNEAGGFVFPVDDVSALQHALQRVFEDEEFRLVQGRVARKVALEQFSVERTASEYLALYREVAPQSI